MPLKLFCDFCEKFIRNAHPNDKGEQICPECGDRIKGIYDEIDKLSRTTQLSIQKISDKGKAKIEMALARVVKEE